jgi:hypothetical protein
LCKTGQVQSYKRAKERKRQWKQSPFGLMVPVQMLTRAGNTKRNKRLSLRGSVLRVSTVLAVTTIFIMRGLIVPGRRIVFQ